jgi:hypothetical protein
MNLMKLAPLVVALGALAGCDRPAPEAAKPAPPPVGRWAIQPIPGGFRDALGTQYVATWRLDSQTGDVSLCYFASGELLKCLLPEPAPPPLGH